MTENADFKISQEGVDLIKRFEGLSLKAYRCPSGLWSIGYGHTGTDVKPGQEITKEEALELFYCDLDEVSHAVKSLVTGPLNTHQFSALVSFAYNCGVTSLKRSKLLKLVNEGADPAPEFMKWIRANGKVLPGLILRRKAEHKLFGRHE